METKGRQRSTKIFGKIAGKSIHLLGAKGSGMCALAEILVARGAVLRGSDTEEVFYTDEILEELGVSVEVFEKADLGDASLLIYSAAYDDSNPVMQQAMKRGIEMYNYPEFLGELSRMSNATAIAGVHGKTTTTAMAATLFRALGMPATVIVGSAVATLGNRCTWSGGSDFLVAETCEYRRHFMHFSPRRIVLTSIESDHQDYYPTYESIFEAFLDFIRSLPEGGELIYCSDDKGARDAALQLHSERADLIMRPYGVNAPGKWGVDFLLSEAGANRFLARGIEEDFLLRVPGEHLALNAVAALCLCDSLLGELGMADAGGLEVLKRDAGRRQGKEYDKLEQSREPGQGRYLGISAELGARAKMALESFRGSRRRSEIIGESGGILVMDDYAHHPTAIEKTLKALKDFYPGRRLIVDFMSHTFSRTAALLDSFSRSLRHADILFLHPVYSSAREEYDGSITGKDLWRRVTESRSGESTFYCETFEEALVFLKSILQENDLFISLGAGNNRSLALELFLEVSNA